jgi:hypothetical protein
MIGTTTTGKPSALGLAMLGALLVVGASGPSQAQTIKARQGPLAVEQIPLAALATARALRMSLDHASVGGNSENGRDDPVALDAARCGDPKWCWRNRGNPGWQAEVLAPWRDRRSRRTNAHSGGRP